MNILALIALLVVVFSCGFVTGIYAIWYFLFQPDVTYEEFIKDVTDSIRERIDRNERLR